MVLLHFTSQQCDLSVKFEVTSFNTSEAMSRTKIHNKNLQKAITR